MSPKTVRSHQEHWHWKKTSHCLTFFIRQSSSNLPKWLHFPLHRWGNRGTNWHCSFHYTTGQRTPACTTCPDLSPRWSPGTAAPPVEGISCAQRDTANTNGNWVTDGAVGAPTCLYIVLVTSVPSVGNKALHTHSLGKAQNLFPSTGVMEGGSSTTILH